MYLRGSNSSGSGHKLGSWWMDHTGTSRAESTGMVTPLITVVSLDSRETTLKNIKSEIRIRLCWRWTRLTREEEGTIEVICWWLVPCTEVRKHFRMWNQHPVQFYRLFPDRLVPGYPDRDWGSGWCRPRHLKWSGIRPKETRTHSRRSHRHLAKPDQELLNWPRACLQKLPAGGEERQPTQDPTNKVVQKVDIGAHLGLIPLYLGASFQWPIVNGWWCKWWACLKERIRRKDGRRFAGRGNIRAWPRSGSDPDRTGCGWLPKDRPNCERFLSKLLFSYVVSGAITCWLRWQSSCNARAQRLITSKLSPWK